jgi:hypothetical protein
MSWIDDLKSALKSDTETNVETAHDNLTDLLGSKDVLDAGTIEGKDQIENDVNSIKGVSVQGSDALHADEAAMAALGKHFLNQLKNGSPVTDAERTLIGNQVGAIDPNNLQAVVAAGERGVGQNATTASNQAKYAAENIRGLSNQDFAARLGEYSRDAMASHVNRLKDTAQEGITGNLDRAEKEGQQAIKKVEDDAFHRRKGTEYQKQQADYQFGQQIAGAVTSAAGAGVSAGTAAYSAGQTVSPENAASLNDQYYHNYQDPSGWRQASYDSQGNTAGSVYGGNGGTSITTQDVFQ